MTTPAEPMTCFRRNRSLLPTSVLYGDLLHPKTAIVCKVKVINTDKRRIQTASYHILQECRSTLLSGRNVRLPRRIRPPVSHGEYAYGTDRRTDRRTYLCQNVTLCFPPSTSQLIVAGQLAITILISLCPFYEAQKSPPKPSPEVVPTTLRPVLLKYSLQFRSAFPQRSRI